MISKISVRNFKSLKDISLNTSMLTVLCGVNGSGKSSLIQSLILLRQYASSSKDNVRVSLQETPLQFGIQRDIRYCFDDHMQSIDFEVERDDGDGRYSGSLLLDNPSSDGVDLRRNNDSFNDGSLVTAIKSINYISANRLPPMQEHVYLLDRVRSRMAGFFGENAIAYLEDHKDDPVQCKELWFDENDTDILLGNQVNAWLGAISPGASARTSKDESVSRAYLNIAFAGYSFRPQNVGFGISHVLPLIIAILSAKKGDIIVMENPEAHLHPSGQAAFGKLLIKAAMAGIQIFVETHSDHIINGVRVATKHYGDRAEGLASVEFFSKRVYNPVGGMYEEFSIVEHLSIDKHGELSDYPDGFLDEWTVQLTKLI